ncbi:ABC transporter ATP-binding protein [Photobacterium sp. BZF1]|uniref:ABC transporter ATP-binding protein n=1 Tax=Photobacterium sp. BZF1 TaxID=1904457 RepID=UPI001653969B|nr:ABC transporter ATP-binding protein [Photobacterium sp. BZF1]MBC7006632.1 ABC transporter ATP-binding protein [Photobacterium sp. BZF1]
MPNIHLNSVSKQYEKNAAPAVNAVDLEINDGEFMCLLGPSGCGKTTTLRMIAGLENISDGQLLLGDTLVDSKQDGVFVPPEKRNLGLVFQSYALWPHLTVEKNIDFGLKLRKIEKAEREKTIHSVMKTLGIEKYRHRYPSQLSGGQQQRVALARMLAVQPDILLMDEPLSNLDARLRLEMRTELKRIHNAFKTTIVFVTHDQWEAMALATKIAVMKDGELQQVGTPNDIYDRPANRFVAEFVGTPPINIIELDEASLCSELARNHIRAYVGHDIPGGSIGLRPERMSVAAADANIDNQKAFRLHAKLEGILPTGGSWILEFSVADHRLHVNTQTPPHYKEGESLSLVINNDNLHLFDNQGLAIDMPCMSSTSQQQFQK